MSTKLYESDILFLRAQLHLDSALHIATGDMLEYEGAASLYTDGNGRPVIPGSAFAGVFVSDAIAIRQRNPGRFEKIWRCLTGKGAEPDAFDGSLFGFPTLSLMAADDMAPEKLLSVRDGTRIERKTRSAQDGAKFSKQVLDPGLIFELSLRLNLFELDDDLRKDAIELATAVLQRWCNPDCGGFVGGGSARGTGWFHLTDLRAHAVNSPDTLRSYLDAGGDAAWQPPQACNVPAIEKSLSLPERNVWNLRLSPRVEKEYGRWPLLVRDQRSQDDTDLKFTRSRWWDYDEDSGAWKARQCFVIAGSAMRGAARSFLESLAESPLTHLHPDTIKALFGSLDDDAPASRLRFRDAYLVAQPDTHSVKQERVALDEFTRGAFESAKFSQQPLFTGAFDGRIALDFPADCEAQLVELLQAWGGADMPWVGLGAHSSPAIWSLNHAQ